MTPVRTVTSLLAVQPEDDLREMQQSIRAELDRLQVELTLVEEALGRRKRRQPSRRATVMPTAGRAHGGRFTGLKREELFAAIEGFGRPVRPLEVHDALLSKGFDVSSDSVRTGMSRLEKNGKLFRVEEGLYAIPNANGHSGTHDASAGADPLFRGTDQSQGQNPDTG